MPSTVRRCVVSTLVVIALTGLLAAAGAAEGDAVPSADGDRPVAGASGLVVSEASAVLPESMRAGDVAAPLTTTASTTFLSDGFEGSFPGTKWTLWHSSTEAANVDWGKSSYRKSAGSYSIWCAGAGPASPGAGHDVPANMNSWVIAGPFNLSSVTSGTLKFDVWLESESGYDFFKWMASVDGTNWKGLQTSTTTGGWSTVTQDLTDWGSANVTGHSQVWIALVYSSDSGTSYEGAYVDQVVLSGDGGGSSNCGTYVITSDNDNNTSSGTPDGDWNYCLFNDDPKHPIDFHVDLNETSVQTAQLLLLCYDVDEEDPEDPEVDKVYMNGTYLGNLTGANNEDSTTVLTVPTSALLIGRNWVDIQVDQSNGTKRWCVNLKQAQLIINGGCSGRAQCRSVTTNQTSYAPGATVAVTYEIDTSATSQQVRVETDILNPSGVIVAGSDQVYATSGTSNDPKTVNLALPGNAAAGTYTAKVLVFDNASGALESSCEKSFTVTGGGGGGCTLTCSASVPTTATVGVPVQFTASATASGCSSAPEYFWYPDTSTTATSFERSFTVTYDQPGTHNWQLVVVADNQRCERTGTITVTSGGGGSSPVVWVPVGSRSPGANGSIWRTDLGILNGNGISVTVTITIYTTSGPITRTVTIPAGGQKVITDVIGWVVPNSSLSGAIRISSTAVVIITSRTYNAFPVGDPCFPRGTTGQSLDGLAVTSGLSTGMSGWLPHMIENTWFRSNIGYTNTGSGTANLTVRLYNGNGSQVGSYTVTLAPGQWKQYSQPFRKVGGQTSMAAGSAKITVTSGSGVFVYGSVLDNVTNDPTTIIMRR